MDHLEPLGPYTYLPPEEMPSMTGAEWLDVLWFVAICLLAYPAAGLTQWLLMCWRRNL